MKTPRILILMHYMELGGAESALLGLLKAHDPARAQMDVFIYDQRGDLMPYIPQNKVNLLPEVPDYSVLERPIVSLLKRGFWKIAFFRLIGRMKTRSYAKYNTRHLDDATGVTFQQRETVKWLPKINPEIKYDLAISFITPHYIVLDKVCAKKKMGWIHTDYTNIFINPKMELEMWSRLDYIASISPEVGEKFLTVFPTLREKLIPIENILSADFIRERSCAFKPEEMPQKDGIINLLSIGRYCYPKRFDQLGTIVRLMVEEILQQKIGFQFHWFLIGYGSYTEEQKIRQNLNQEGVESYVTLLGKRDNPYPYLKACDLYIQPSRYEGKSVTVREAQILQCPVVVTNYPTASSQISDGKDGVIVPFDNESCARGIISFLLNTEKQKNIIHYLSKNDYGNEGEIEKIYSLVES